MRWGQSQCIFLDLAPSWTAWCEPWGGLTDQLNPDPEFSLDQTPDFVSIESFTDTNPKQISRLKTIWRNEVGSLIEYPIALLLWWPASIRRLRTRPFRWDLCLKYWFRWDLCLKYTSWWDLFLKYYTFRWDLSLKYMFRWDLSFKCMFRWDLSFKCMFRWDLSFKCMFRWDLSFKYMFRWDLSFKCMFRWDHCLKYNAVK